MTKKNYYEILGVAPHVGSGQVQAAYRFARSLYSGESTPTYGFLDSEERARMLALVEEAFGALSNPSARRDYDLHLGSRGTTAGAAPEAEPARRPHAPVPALEEASPQQKVPSSVHAPEPETPALRVPEIVTGGVLRSLRESRGLSIDQIAALSKVGSRFLKALEDDRHQVLPGRVFARGFLIEYARALRVSEPDLADRDLKNWSPK